MAPPFLASLNLILKLIFKGGELSEFLKQINIYFLRIFSEFIMGNLSVRFIIVCFSDFLFFKKYMVPDIR